MYSLGVDIGTSGIRAVIMDARQRILAQAQKALSPAQSYYSVHLQISGYEQNPMHWWTVFEAVILQLKKELHSQSGLSLNAITSLAIDGTSGTVLLADKSGTPCSDALMYNDQRAVQEAKEITRYAPDNTAAIGATSGLAKIVWLYTNSHCRNSVCYALNQSDWISGKLIGNYRLSDHNNALKMGYDAQQHGWPEWLIHFLERLKVPVSILPRVFLPGQPLGSITPELAQRFGFSPSLKICAGTTDSTAAIIASGAKEPGEAITSLGSTLVMKVISKQPVFAHQSGVYSQPYGDLWLVGGASNSGGEVLKQYFCPGEISELTQALNTRIADGNFAMLDLGYYPLSSAGERFPVQDPDFQPVLIPRPEQEIDFFQAILEGMADIETMAYKHLLELDAPYPKLVKSIGGGAFNKAWRFIREQKLGVPVILTEQQQAAAGSAILAQKFW